MSSPPPPKKPSPHGTPGLPYSVGFRAAAVPNTLPGSAPLPRPLPPSSSFMIYARMSRREGGGGECPCCTPPTDVTIRLQLESSHEDTAIRTSCRLPIVRCALLAVNARRLCESRQREPIIPALLPRNGKTGRKRERERESGRIGAVSQ